MNKHAFDVFGLLKAGENAGDNPSRSTLGVFLEFAFWPKIENKTPTLSPTTFIPQIKVSKAEGLAYIFPFQTRKDGRIAGRS